MDWKIWITRWIILCITKITSKIEKGYFLQFLTPERMKLLGSTKNKITIHENGEDVRYLEITEVILVHCNIVNND